MRPIVALLIVGATAGVAAAGWWWRVHARRRRVLAWRRTHALFTQIVDLVPAERARALLEETENDPVLRDQVAGLLAAHDVTGPLDRLHAQLAGPAPASAPAPLDAPSTAVQPAAPLVAGRYRLLHRLGAGGMGEVHRARDERLGRDVALKFLTTQGDAGGVARRRFVREARAAAALDHPNLCTVHEIGETEDGRLFIAMALSDGETLADRIARGPLDWTEAVAIARQVARGLDCAHAAGVVHRDIKPANLCITHDGVVKIVDFGIAMVVGTTIGDAGPLLGTVAYMSPEQVRGEVVGNRSDLWSLGVVCHEMLTGTRPFIGGDWLAIMAAIRSEGPVPLGSLRGTAPLPVIRVIADLLARDPRRRPGSAGEVDQLFGRAMIESEFEPESAGEVPAVVALGGERRQVTVLACRVPASGVALSPSLVEETVRRHGGRCGTAGDEWIEAFFGVAITREDDQLRAAQTAAELHELAGLDAKEPPSCLSIGIASATVDVAVDEQTDATPPARYRLGGSLISDTRRLAAFAEPGTTVVSDPNRRRLTGQFAVVPCRLDDRASAELPGDVAIVRPREHATAWSDTDVNPLTAFTGRRRELDALDAAFEAVRWGDGRMITVAGDAGSGKSRLVHEFLRRLDDTAVRVVAGHCQAHAGSKPYHPWIEAMRSIIDLDAANPARQAPDVVARAVEAIDPALGGFLPIYLHLLAIGGRSAAAASDAEPARQAIRDALTGLFTQASQRRPLVVLLEDWQWTDEASGDVLRQLANIGAPQLLVVVTQREDPAVPWSGIGSGTRLRLAPLPLDETRAMACALLDVPTIADDIIEPLHERTGGNPLYLEELCRSLREAGMLRVDQGVVVLSHDREQLHLPATIQGIIRGRLDRLGPDAREVLRAAAVLGRDFTLPLLVRMGVQRYELSRVLESLTTLGLVRQTRVVPERAFRFSHALIHEVAYETLLPHQRRALHRQAARALVAAHPDQLDEYASRIALQYEGSEEWLEAARYACLAAGRSRRLSEAADALVTLEAADRWLDREPPGPMRDEVRMEVLLEAEGLCETLGRPDRQAELLERLLALPVAQVDRGRLAEIHRRRGDRFTLLRDFARARDALELALRLAREAGNSATEGRVLRSLGLTGWHSGDIEAGLPHVEAAIALERQRDDVGALAISLAARAQLLKGIGRSDEALREFDEALRATEGLPDDLLRSTVLHGAATLCRTMGDLDRASDFLQRAVAEQGRSYNPVFRSFNLISRAYLELERGDLNGALALARDAVDQARSGGFADGLARSLNALGEMLVSLDRHAEAVGHLEEAAELHHRLGRAALERRLCERAASIAERSGDLARAHAAWTRCLELSAAHPGSTLEIRARLGVARTGRRTAVTNVAVAREILGRALDDARTAGLAPEEAQAHNSLGILEWEGGEPERALPHFEAALEIFTRLEDSLHVAVMHNSLGATQRTLGRLRDACFHLETARAGARRVGHRLVEGHALALLGEVALDAGDYQTARKRICDSLAIRCEVGDSRGEGWMRHALARIDAKEGEREAAQRALEQSREIAIRIGDAELLEACDAGTATGSMIQRISSAPVHPNDQEG